MKKNTNFIELGLKNSNQLLNEIHHYIRRQAPLDVKYMSKNDVFKVSCEAMRVTVRITQIIGWLMLQNAILDGEITREEVRADSPHILHGKSCLDTASETDLFLPYRLRELLKQSRELYIRTMKLEEMSLRTPPLPEEIKKKRDRISCLYPKISRRDSK